MREYRPRTRACSACQARAIYAQPGDEKRYNCANATAVASTGKPDCCWERLYPKSARDVLAAIRPYVTKGAEDQRRLSAKRELAQATLELAEKNELNNDTISLLAARYSQQVFTRFKANLPPNSPIERAFTEHSAHARALKKSKQKASGTKSRPRGTAHIVRSQEFRDGISLWEEAYKARGALKARFGHPYHVKTVRRIVTEAQRFCEFLEAEGVERWVDVAQRHLDGYIDVSSREAGHKAYAFLRYIARRFRIRSKFKRPENRVPAVRPRLMPMSQINSLLERVHKEGDSELALAISFVALYAQTVAALSLLTTEQVRETDQGYEVMFNEVWIPLDAETATKLSEYLRDRADWVEKNAGKEIGNGLFKSNYDRLLYKVNLGAAVPLKDLRLTALANILKTGITDRRGLEISLGVSQATVAIIERVCGWDFQYAVSDEAAQVRRDLIDGKLTDR